MRAFARIVLALFPIFGAALAHAEAALPIIGTWGPGGRAFESYGNMVVSKNSLSWAGCKRVPYRVLSDTTGDSYPGDAYRAKTPDRYRIILIRVSDSACFPKNKTYIQFAIPKSRPDHADVVLYESPGQFRKGYYGWSGFGRREGL